jgi:flagellar protein FliO/FliZ
VWFLVQIPFISAQEAAEQGELSPVTETEVNDPRAAERNIFFGEETPAQAQTAGGSSVWVIIRTILVLALVAAAVYGIVYFIKRSAKQTPESNPFLKILATAHLGSNRYAHIVAVGSQAWLLGSSDGGVNLIGEVDDKDVINAMLLEDSRKVSEAPSNRFPDFLSMLRRLGAHPESRSSGADDIRKRRERLKDL